jgi:DNA repair photolyase
MFKGKAIYNPSGKAGEYSYWACNFYVGCSNGCTYCYLKKGRGAKILGGNKPQLKKCFDTYDHTLNIFEKEILKNIDELKKHGVFFSFSTDPMLDETYYLTIEAIELCQVNNIPVKILTKSVEYMDFLDPFDNWDRTKVAVGFTLTGYDELEPKASTNEQRIYSMSILKEQGFKTFASIEPIIDFPSSKRMIELALPYCDLFKVGLESGKKYDVVEAQTFVEWLSEIGDNKVYIKESLQKLTGYDNEWSYNFVERDYNMF